MGAAVSAGSLLQAAQRPAALRQLSSPGECGLHLLWDGQIVPSAEYFSLLSADLQPSYYSPHTLSRQESQEQRTIRLTALPSLSLILNSTYPMPFCISAEPKRCVWHFSRMLEREREAERKKDFFARCPGDTTARAATQYRMGGRVEDPL